MTRRFLPLIFALALAQATIAESQFSTVVFEPQTRSRRQSESRKSLVPALFIFGDSSVDCGNNNNLITIARATFPPYGRDFDTHKPTGRFTNGRLGVDYLARLLRLPLIPAYLDCKNVEHGVNFASAGSGILNTTGKIYGQYVSLDKQIANMRDIRARLVAKHGRSKTSRLLSQSMFYISTGTNDIIHTKSLSNEEFLTTLVISLARKLRQLYKLGARKIAVASLSPVGRIPNQMRKYKNVDYERGVPTLANAARSFNEKLFIAMETLSYTLPESILVYNNVYEVFDDILRKHRRYGFKYIERGCCGMGNRELFPCLPSYPVCSNASEYVYWDGLHPTSTAYKILANRLWSGSIQDSFPVNLRELATLRSDVPAENG